MKAVVYHRYGGPEVLEYTDIDKPDLADDRVLVRVRAASLNPYDWHFMRGKPRLMRLMSGLTRPKNPGIGADLAGTVEAVGKNATSCKAGDEVYGECHGALAEYAAVAEKNLAPKPFNLSFEQTAAIPIAGLTALQGLRDHGKLQAGQHVLINGASGGVGTFAVQIAKAMGATVTGVCSGRNAEMVRSIGADHVIDYTKENFTSGGERYDLILDTVGNHSLRANRRALTDGGRYVVVGSDSNTFGPLVYFAKLMLYNLVVTHEFKGFIADPNRNDFLFLNELCQSGKLVPVIDKSYTLDQAREAMEYLETKRVRGKLVVKM